MTPTNPPTPDPILAVYGRLIQLAEAARRERQQQADTAVQPDDTAVDQAAGKTAVVRPPYVHEKS